MSQLFIPQIFDSLFPQYIHWYVRDAHSKKRATDVHILWRDATSFIRPGYARFFMFKDRSETMAGFGNFVFSTLRIEVDDTPGFEKWLEAGTTDSLGVLSDFTGAGFKVSVAYVVDQNSFCVTVVGTKDTKKHEGMGMSSWSDDLNECLAMAWYKHFVLCDAGEWPTKNRGNRWG